MVEIRLQKTMDTMLFSVRCIDASSFPCKRQQLYICVMSGRVLTMVLSDRTAYRLTPSAPAAAITDDARIDDPNAIGENPMNYRVRGVSEWSPRNLFQLQ
uniref:Uncharacterized protein n=1 Tax=Spongospora subterranea TaxID=70186 RepID=A0A0H5QMH7_9EUKA|eukprot:CRZ03203.1 hypothetical protein [Spongospora subterranea]